MSGNATNMNILCIYHLAKCLEYLHLYSDIERAVYVCEAPVMNLPVPACVAHHNLTDRHTFSKGLDF